MEELFSDMRAEDFSLKSGKLGLNAGTWPGFASGKKEMIVAVSMRELPLAALVARAMHSGYNFGSN